MKKLLFSFFVTLMGILALATTSFAATSVVYNALPDPLPPNAPSQPFQAQQTFEFGDYVHLGGTNRILSTITVAMSDWALYSDYTGDIRYLGNSSTWTHPITITVYSNHLGSNGAPDTPLATMTQDIVIPWRPVADPTCATATAWRASDGDCYNGFAFNAVFDLSSLNVTLPNDVIVSLAYNTQTYGTAPIDTNGPYNSLNVLVPTSQLVTVGTDDNINNVFWNTVTASYYADGGAAGVGIFRQDTGWVYNNEPVGTVAMKIEANAPAPAPKIDVCHKVGKKGFNLINISENAKPAHIAHGDVLPGDIVVGNEDKKYAEDCSIVDVWTLLQTIVVPGTTNAGIDSNATLSGTTYRLKATGTYTFANWTDAGLADARYSLRLPGYNNPAATPQWIDGSVFLAPYTDYLKLWVNGPVSWNGSYSDHTYTYDFVGTGSPIHFSIMDDNYGDNVGGLEVGIYAQ